MPLTQQQDNALWNKSKLKFDHTFGLHYVLGEIFASYTKDELATIAIWFLAELDEAQIDHVKACLADY